MRAVWSRELRAFANCRKGWILGSILLFVNGLFMTLYHFYVGNTRYEIILGSVMLAIACMLPLWTVSRFCRECREGEIGFLRLLPLTSEQIFFGKILGSVTLLGGAFLILAVFPVVLSFFGGKNFLSAYVSLIVAFLLGCALLFILTLVAMLCRKKWMALAVSYGVVAVLFVLARISAVLPDSAATVVSYLSLFGALEPYALSVFDWRIALWYGAIALLFFGLCCRFSFEKRCTRIHKRGILSCILALVMLGATVGAAFLPAHQTEIDMSTSGMMSVSDDTKRFLETVDEDVTVYLLEDVEADRRGEGYEDRKFEYFMEKYASYSDRVRLERLPIAESGTVLAELGFTTDQVYQYCMVIKGEKRTQVLDYMSLLSYVHNNQNLYAFGLPYEFSYSQFDSYASAMASLMLQDSTTYGAYYYAFYNDVALHFKGERYLNAAIEYVTADLIPQKYVLTGNGERELPSVALGDLIGSCAVLSLSEGASVPADASSVIVLGPTVDFTPAVVQGLTDYLNRGGTVTVITGEANLSMPNLMGFLGGFGLSAQSGAVHENETKTVKQEDGSETTETVRTNSVKTSVNLNHDALAAMESLGTDALSIRVTNGNAIRFHKTEDPSLLTTSLLTTSENAFVGETENEKGSLTLAAVAENNKGARLVWFTGSDTFLASTSQVTEKMDMAYAMVCPYLAAEWTDLVYRSQLNAAPAVLYEEPYLEATSTHMVIFVLIAIVILPALVITVGMVRIYKRKKA